MTDKEKRVPVSVRAVIQRINRRLKGEGQLLKTCREGRNRPAGTGQYYIVSTRCGRLIETNCCLEKLARRENALELWEDIQPKEGGA